MTTSFDMKMELEKLDKQLTTPCTPIPLSARFRSYILYDGRRAGGGAQRVYRFANGYGISVVCGIGSYGGQLGLWEAWVIRHPKRIGDFFEFNQDVKEWRDPVGYLSPEDIDQLVRKVRAMTNLRQAARRKKAARARCGFKRRQR